MPVPTLVFDHLGHTQQDPTSGSIIDSSIEENSPSIAEGTAIKGSTCQQLDCSFLANALVATNTLATSLIKPKKLSNKPPSSSIQQQLIGEQAVASTVELCLHRRHNTGISIRGPPSGDMGHDVPFSYIFRSVDRAL